MNSIAIVVISLLIIVMVSIFFYWLTAIWYLKRSEADLERAARDSDQEEEPRHIEDIELHSGDPRTWPRRNEVSIQDPQLRAAVDDWSLTVAVRMRTMRDVGVERSKRRCCLVQCPAGTTPDCRSEDMVEIALKE
ncbi:hypothetical protein BST61_g11027 [Cercospora zeina]